MGQLFRRHIGQILVDGNFMSKNDLDQALEEQKHTRALLGQVLVGMGILKVKEIDAPLIVQKYLGNIDDAVRIAAGERQLLGALLVQSGRISGAQLDHAIAEQKRSGEKLGEVFVRLGMLTEDQLAALLDFQHNQGDPNTVSPLRLGELLVGTGHISRAHLDDALIKQRLSQKKLGEVLVDEGYASPGKIKKGIRLQKMLVSSVLAAIISLGMSATGHANGVQLQWDPNAEPDIAGYKVYYAPDSSSLAGATPVDVQNQTSATISGLDPASNYNFAVTAYNVEGLESSFSNIVPVAERMPPAVAITYPADNSSVSGVVSVSIAAEDNVGVTKVEYFVNNQLHATETSAPCVFLWDTTSLPQGTYTLTAKAYDAAGNISQSISSVTVVNDLIAPAVALTSPSNNATVSGIITVNAGASDNVGVSKVEFYTNNVLVYASNVPPYSFNWDTTSVANGNYTLRAKAFDNAGNSSFSLAVTVTVDNLVPDITAPSLLSFTLPATSSSLTVPVTGLTASDNVGVTGYMITENAITPSATAAGWSSSAPASFTFSSAGSKIAYAWAKDAAGNISAQRSATVTISTPDVTAPVVTIPSPVDGAIVKGTITVTAGASDNVKVTKVEFYINGVLKQTKTSSPYTYSWNTKYVKNGSYRLSAKAYDAAGNIGQSTGITVTVKNRVR